MKKIKITSKTPEYFKKGIVNFINKHGDGHITKKAIEWIINTPFSKIDKKNGDVFHIILDNKNNIVGLICIVNYGLKYSIIVVHHKARKNGIANILTSGVLEDINRFYVKVANDNIPSLTLCFSIGMRAFHLTKGPTGKPTLILGYGDWNKEEWFNRKT